jgi:hypothetical protein
VSGAAGEGSGRALHTVSGTRAAWVGVDYITGFRVYCIDGMYVEDPETKGFDGRYETVIWRFRVQSTGGKRQMFPRLWGRAVLCVKSGGSGCWLWGAKSVGRVALRVRRVKQRNEGEGESQRRGERRLARRSLGQQALATGGVSSDKAKGV